MPRALPKITDILTAIQVRQVPSLTSRDPQRGDVSTNFHRNRERKHAKAAWGDPHTREDDPEDTLCLRFP